MNVRAVSRARQLLAVSRSGKRTPKAPFNSPRRAKRSTIRCNYRRGSQIQIPGGHRRPGVMSCRGFPGPTLPGAASSPDRWLGCVNGPLSISCRFLLKSLGAHGLALGLRWLPSCVLQICCRTCRRRAGSKWHNRPVRRSWNWRCRQSRTGGRCCSDRCRTAASDFLRQRTDDLGNIYACPCRRET